MFGYLQRPTPHSHSENNLKNQRSDNLLRPQNSRTLLEQDRDFKRVYFATFESCRKQTPPSHSYRNRFQKGHHFAIGLKILYEIHGQELSQNCNNDDWDPTQ